MNTRRIAEVVELPVSAPRKARGKPSSHEALIRALLKQSESSWGASSPHRLRETLEQPRIDIILWGSLDVLLRFLEVRRYGDTVINDLTLQYLSRYKASLQAYLSRFDRAMEKVRKGRGAS